MQSPGASGSAAPSKPGRDARRRGRLRWLLCWAGAALVVAAVLSYFTLAVRWPALRDFPWPNLLLLAAGLGLAAFGLARTWPAASWLARAGAGLGFVLALAPTWFFLDYLFVRSYEVPDAAIAAPAGAAIPHVVLRDAQGAEVDVGQLARGNVLLVFFRGFW